MDPIQQLTTLYQTVTGKRPSIVTRLAGAGSNRTYYRLGDMPSYIGVVGTSIKENKAFIALSTHFTDMGLPMPRVIATSDDKLCYLQDDLGDVSLFDCIQHGRSTGVFDETEVRLLKKVMELLPVIQFKGGASLDYTCCYPQQEFDNRSIRWDLNYFKYCFLKMTGIELEEDVLENDFDRLAGHLLQIQTGQTFLYRDFQSRNVMIKDGEPWFIDFQGGRRGPIHYDVASFLWQAKANLPEELRRELIEDYLHAAAPYQQLDRTRFIRELRLFVFFRMLQVLGAYGFRGMIEKKVHFLESIPFAMASLKEMLDDFKDEYPYLTQLLERVSRLPRFLPRPPHDELTVKVMSFSFHKGIPEDESGNGGGYVFDCRAIHNPGRYVPYKTLTGRDAPVIEFLEKDGEILDFLSHVDSLVDFHVETYLRRGFKDLMICFGCTGGQHRSVYAAEHVAHHLHEKYGVKVQLCHREQQINITLE